jgi:zinc protease
MRWWVVAVAALAATCKPPEPKRSLAIKLAAERFSGSNGVEVVTMPDPGAEFVGFHVRYAAGSIEDPPGKEGLAHLVEHLMFSRTLDLAGRVVTIGTRIDELALFSNAFTRRDHTHYITVVPIQHLEEMFAIETVRMTGGCVAIDQQTFEREREVVRNEIRQRGSGDLARLRPRLLAEAYGAHPYGRPIGGTDESLRAITRDDVCRYIGSYYVPARARFIVTGAVDPTAVRDVASKWLGRIPPRENPPRPERPPLEIRPRALEITGRFRCAIASRRRSRAA